MVKELFYGVGAAIIEEDSTRLKSINLLNMKTTTLIRKEKE